MYLTGVSVRRVEDITEALWGISVSTCYITPPDIAIASLVFWRGNLILLTAIDYVYFL